MRILITGGGGFIGMVTGELLARKGYDEVTLLDQIHPRETPPGCSFLRADVNEPLEFGPAIHGADFIIHLAALVGYPACDANPGLAWQTNVDSVKYLKEHTEDRHKVFFPSTQSVYGSVKDVCNERSGTAPTSLYAETKCIAEETLRDRAVIYRFPTGFGVSPTMRDDLLINDFVRTSIREDELTVFQRNYQRSFIHVSDMAASILFAIDHYDGMVGEIYNVGDEEMNLTKQDITDKIHLLLGTKILYGEGEDPELRNYFVDYGKAHDIGLYTKVRIDEGIKELATYYASPLSQ